jgi:hypothetical protein
LFSPKVLKFNLELSNKFSQNSNVFEQEKYSALLNEKIKSQNIQNSNSELKINKDLTQMENKVPIDDKETNIHEIRNRIFGQEEKNNLDENKKKETTSKKHKSTGKKKK